MDNFLIDSVATDFLAVLIGGLVAGIICKRTGVSMLVGYLLIGAFIGQGCLGLVSQDDHELELMASAGALLLLFAVGLEFSIEQLVRLRKFIFLGGAFQMTLVIVPVYFVARLAGFSWAASCLLGASASLSSTILVFKALNEWGQAATPHGRRAIAMLLFQDVALVPVMLLVPALSPNGDVGLATKLVYLALTASLVVIAVYWIRRWIARFIVPSLIELRSTELVVLFAVIVLSGACWISDLLEMPAAVGALASGLMLSGNRLTHQIDTLILPFRETFAAIFFVTLGSLLSPQIFFEQPILMLGILGGIVLIKASAATVSLKITGLPWRQSFGSGLGLSQLGEFSFLLVGAGVAEGIFNQEDYQRTLFVAIGTLVLTPQLIKVGLKLGRLGNEVDDVDDRGKTAFAGATRAIVVGIGVIGGRTAARLETLGVQVCLVDHSPLNLYPFAQQGFQTVTGDALDDRVLKRLELVDSQMAVVSVPDDLNAIQIVAKLRERNPDFFILVRCRYFLNIGPLEKAGASRVVSEEKETSSVITQICEKLLWESRETERES
ncbi:cation:proton antiporter [Rhodopirellula sp.]|jgi:CPA2 family monovalent cation:H+ antiporter-2|nr:cation:proton antiporter [Rhodopirellula sp.]